MADDADVMRGAVAILDRARRGERVPMPDVAGAVDDVVAVTSRSYSRLASTYKSVRSESAWAEDAVFNEELISAVRELISAGKLEVSVDGMWSLLDIGAGYGRDVEIFAAQPDIVPSALDNARSFVDALKARAAGGALKGGVVYSTDMRDLSEIPSESFHCVRNHATLHHLPVVGDAIGADAAVAETRRVLRPHGVFYVTVKAGEGVDVIDTGEGMGGRFFQLFTPDLLEGLLANHRFSLLKLRTAEEPRPSGAVSWIMALAEAS